MPAKLYGRSFFGKQMTLILKKYYMIALYIGIRIIILYDSIIYMNMYFNDI